ncbi:chain-length determining protein [Brevundimonas sp. 2P06AA]|uniref:chain-length determining protein n=1 Tax=unclassified Brevundimonas TaxID=2622653 RepID=UPI0039A00123
MTEPQLTYLGPNSVASNSGGSRADLWRKVPIGFVLVVVVPTLLAMLYYLFFASPRYVAEAKFMVRSSAQEQPSILGAALQGVGISSTSSSVFAVHEYVRSRDAVRELQKTVNLDQAYGRSDIDIFSRRPHPWQDRSFDTLYKGFQSYVTVGHEAATGISTLRVEAFSAKEAQRINNALLFGGERLINQLNVRSSRDALVESERTLEEAQARLTRAQAGLTAFRNREGVIDPGRTALAATELIGELKLKLATLQAQRSQVVSTAPQSPQISMLNSEVAALQRQIELEEARVVGERGSLAPKIATYEDLILEKEFSDRLVASATAALNSARLDGRRQHLYLVRVVNPDAPDRSSEPRRWMMILTVFATALVVYGIGWLVLASIRESRTH